MEKFTNKTEIEFLTTDIEDAANQLVVAKWVMRRLAYQYGVTLTFAPKITVGKAGSGMHIHCMFTRNGKSVMTNEGKLTDECRKAIAGYMVAGTSLPAFGNPHPLSFMRLVPNQEAPTSLCWSFSNRSALVRVPLGWLKRIDMAARCNPGKRLMGNSSDKQTFEWRASDGLPAPICHGSTLLCRPHGFEMPTAVTEKTFVDLGVTCDEKNRAVRDSSNNCRAAALTAQRQPGHPQSHRAASFGHDRLSD